MTDTTPIPLPEEATPSRKRGAPPGNINALKHGFYSQRFNSGELLDLLEIPDGSVKDEIDMLRVITRRVLELMATGATSQDVLDFYKIIGQTCLQISNLLRTQKFLDGNEESRAMIFKNSGPFHQQCIHLFGKNGMTEAEVLYWTEKIHHALDLFDHRIGRLEKDQAHRMEMLIQRVEALERSQADQEARLRTVADGVIRLNTQGSLAAVGQSILSLILAAIAAYIGAK